MFTVLWDNDGVLVDTEGMYFQASHGILGSVGIDLTLDQFKEISLRRGESTFVLAAGRGREHFRRTGSGSEPHVGELGRVRRSRYGEKNNAHSTNVPLPCQQHEWPCRYRGSSVWAVAEGSASCHRLQRLQMHGLRVASVPNRHGEAELHLWCQRSILVTSVEGRNEHCWCGEGHMWICSKCSKQISDGSKICRACGAILEEVEDKAPTEGDLSGQSDQVPATEEKQDSQVHADSLIRTSENDEDLVETYDDQNQRGQGEALPWTCKKCGEHVPETFDVCWKCGTTQEGLEDPDFGVEPPYDDESVQPDARSGVEPRTADVATTALCVKCNSSKIIPDVRLTDHGQGSDGVSKVVVFGRPDALIFKDRRYGEVKADICGDCGNIELRVRNPRELYEHYLESLDD